MLRLEQIEDNSIQCLPDWLGTYSNTHGAGDDFTDKMVRSQNLQI